MSIMMVDIIKTHFTHNHGIPDKARETKRAKAMLKLVLIKNGTNPNMADLNWKTTIMMPVITKILSIHNHGTQDKARETKKAKAMLKLILKKTSNGMSLNMVALISEMLTMMLVTTKTHSILNHGTRDRVRETRMVKAIHLLKIHQKPLLLKLAKAGTPMETELALRKEILSTSSSSDQRILVSSAIALPISLQSQVETPKTLNQRKMFKPDGPTTGNLRSGIPRILLIFTIELQLQQSHLTTQVIPSQSITHLI